MNKNTLMLKPDKNKGRFLFLLALFVTFTSLGQTNLLTNGDLESSGGFAVWNYNDKGSGNGSSNAGDYAIVSNAQQLNSGFVSTTDHSGSGKMLVFDSQLNGGRQHFIGLGNNGGGVCALSTTVEHTLSFWIRSVSAGETIDLDVYAGGTWIGYIKAPDVNAGWTQAVFKFTPSSQCLNFTFRHVNDNNYTEAAGRDFAIDEISLTAPPAPLSINTFTNPSSCPNNNDASIEASAFGGDGNYTYTLQGDASGTNNNGVFIGLAPGNYTVRVADTNNEVAVTQLISLSSPVDITATGDATICSGETTNLSVNGSSSGYVWSSSPNDPSIVDTSLANQTVSPTQTTTYTVSSTISSEALGVTNLVTNGNFAQGNVGFDTDYNFRDPANTLKEQKAYGVVSNPKAWEEDFATCPDRSSDNDLMLVVDGSIDVGNNDRIWSQTIPVEPGKDYIFSYWLQNVVSITPPRIETQINGVVVGTELAPAQACGWVRHFYKWNAGLSNTAVISLIDRETALAGNDFAIDDIAFALAVQCTIEKSVTVNVNPQVTATFSFPTNLDLGDVAPVLPVSSDNGLTGTWNPLTIDTSVLGDTVYTFTPNNNQCASGAVVVTVNVRDPLKVDPVFTLPASICNGDVAPILASPSDNGISGAWNPAVIDNTQSGSYLFTPDDLILNNTFTYNLTVTAQTVPTFNGLPATSFCQGDVAPVLPTTSVEGIIGTWAPAVDMNVLGNTLYTFTPDAGQCATTSTTTIVVTPPVIPTFVGLPAAPICESDAAPVLPVTSVEGITGTWAPAVDMSAIGATLYTFTPDAGQCATTATTTITINAQTVPTFNGLPNASFCQGDAAPVLPVTSFEGITGTWDVIDMNVVGGTAYTFTPDAGQCATTAQTTITVTAPVTPTFNGLPAASFCEIDAAPVLPTTSIEGITGTWDAIDMTVIGTSTYTFTPDAGQCAAIATTTITVNAQTTPTFNGLPNAAFCQGDDAPVLPTTSVEGITGSWGVIDMNLVGGTAYTFTPDAGQCATTTQTTITVNAPIIPTFNGLPQTSFCQNTAPPVLPSTSVEGITGTWQAIDMNAVGASVYTFTPDPGQCSLTTTTTVTINPTVLPDFRGAATTICQDDSSYSLPTPSNGITGTWSPSFDSSIVGATIYTFTPNDASQCSVPTQFTLTVNPRPGQISLTGMCNGTNYVLSAAPVNGSYDPATVSYIWRDGNGVQVGLNQASYTAPAADTYTVEVTNAFGCSTTQSLVVASVFCEIPKGISPETTPGENDTFDLTALAPLHVQIFNRYGYEVFERSNYRNEWNGQTNTGKDLPAGTYYYIVQLQSGETRTGWVYLAR